MTNNNKKTKQEELTESAYKERAEEDEGDKVRNGDVQSASHLILGRGLWITQLASHARQHDLLPVLPSGTSNA